jgi:hypothetical protein
MSTTMTDRLNAEQAEDAMRREMASDSIAEFDQGLLDVRGLVDRLDAVLAYDLTDCLAGQHRDEAARVRHQTDWWQCTICRRLERQPRTN